MDSEPLHFVREWLEKAQVDLHAAELLAQESARLSGAAAFHCQQCVEKLLKAFLTNHEQVVDRTHDLGRLCRICAGVDSSFDTLLIRVEGLTQFAVRYRYPGEPEPTKSQVDEAIVAARFAWGFVITRLPADLARFRLEGDS